ncbi:phenylacetic acid degradation protein [Bradyrhizobium guangdongense]|uniref:PaaI family thioesterase n=1 Tax=Bradyrhizobium guangdongense TaxID=1325090 RepID=UPI00112C9497|nr:PaaI family thioesterase [Bradyrhizobium guangdongense]TPQ37062.1 phenylacetic acid degradation protein [Bradyrhizobium guangdongense]
MVKTALDNFVMPPCAKLLGWRLLDARPEEGWIRLGFEGKLEFCNPAGFIQGGLLSAMLDDTMGPAVLVMSEGRLYTTTISMTVNFLAPARPGPLIAEAKVTQLGKTIAFVESKLMAEDGTVIATATASERLLEAARVVR